jgi:hypothetical protein
MTLSLLEGAISAVRDYLETNIAAKLNALDTEYGDFVLDDVKRWYEGNLPAATPEAPSVALLGVGWKTDERTNEKLYLRNLVSVIVMVGDDDEQRRFAKLCRYARAVVELLIAGETTYGYAVEFTDTIAASETLETTPYLQAITIPISLYPLDGETII